METRNTVRAAGLEADVADFSPLPPLLSNPIYARLAQEIENDRGNGGLVASFTVSM